MNKISGKALSMVLSLALVVSSFSALPVSANTTHTVKGTLSDTDNDKIYVVSGETKDSNQVITSDLKDYIFGSKGDKNLETDHHKTEDAKILSVSHSSGDRLVKWYDVNGSNSDDYSKSISTDDNVGLKLRSSSVKGHETLNILYEATYTDDDVDYKVKGSKAFDVYCYDMYQPVICEVGNATDAGKAIGDNDYSQSKYGDAKGSKKSPELSDDFAQRVVTHNGAKDSGEYKTLSVYLAVPTQVDDQDVCPMIKWVKVNTIADKTAVSGGTKDKNYSLKTSNSSAIDMTPDTYTTAMQADGTVPVQADATGSSSGSVTFTATLTSSFKDNVLLKDVVGDGYTTIKNVEKALGHDVTNFDTDEKFENLVSTTKDVTAKDKVDKKILVDDSAWTKLAKYSGSTYLAQSGTSLDSTTTKADQKKAIKANGMEIKFDIGDGADVQDVTVNDKASVSKISGKVKHIDVSDTSSVDAISLDNSNLTADEPSISISDGKVGNIDFGDHKVGTVNIDSTKANVGNITNADKVTVTSGKVGNITANGSDNGKVEIKGDDDTVATVVGDVTAKDIEIDSEDSKVTTGVLKANDDSTEIDLNGSNVAMKGIDLDYRSSSQVKPDDFQGKIPAPVKATEDGSGISTTNSDAKVEVVGDADINSLSLNDDSKVTFDGKLNVNSIDGSGMLVVGAGKMNITGSVASATLKLSDANFAKGTTAFTAATGTVEPDDFTGFGFTLAKTTGAKTDTFKVDGIVFKGVAVNKVSDEIVKGQSATYTAGSYPAGLTIPAGYTIQWSLDGDDSIFQLTTNTNGSATVKAVGFDDQFASENKATLNATLVDADGNTNDDYAVGTCDLTSLLTPNQNFVSDTNGNVKKNVGDTYTFKITSSDGTAPTFTVAGGATVAAAGKSGNAYFYKVTMTKAGSYGVYVNGTRVAILVISNNAKIDTAKVTVRAGRTYTFKVTAGAKPSFSVVGNAVVATSNKGSDYFYTVKATGKAGTYGVYVNGARMALYTVA